MNAVFDSYSPDEEIPVFQYLKNKKLRKYFNRETEAAVVGVGKLTKQIELNPKTPFYYATGIMEYEDYGLKDIVKNSTDTDGNFSQKLFIEDAIPGVSPLNLFKVLQNMPLSFVAIEHHLTGDNAVIYRSASGLLLLGLHSAFNGPMLLGAGKTHKNGKVDAGFAYVHKEEIDNSFFLSSTEEAVDIFRSWAASQKD
ncbi:MAG: hypothetical protein JSV46_05905 [Candidatus Aminicenantes bacterium]|nr:MAG: hypothetical protein JSV46_05905 [Candidatus Aminicenantes bacterium]